MKTLKTRFIFLIALLGLLSGCIRQQKTWILQDIDSESAITNFSNTRNDTYKIQSGDNLYINIYSADKATSTYFQTNFPTLVNQTYLYLNSYIVNEDGYLTFSFIDKMFVRGLTIEEFQKQLQTTMNTYFKDVTVSVKLVNYLISVLGEVNNQGKYEVPEEDANILKVIAQAGGFKDYANRERITLIRQTENGSEVHYLNLKDKNILASQDFYLMPNDVVYVQTLKSKSFTYEKLPYNLFISTLSITIAIMAYMKTN
jgi:polysaccharide export outer membrane protein